MAIPNYSMATVPQFVGRSLGISEWVTVGQDRIDQFATCTGDRQWIHVDVERAKRESPFGAPIAHGYLTLALVGALVMAGLSAKRCIACSNISNTERLASALISAGIRSP
jgi:acyl dehydratase